MHINVRDLLAEETGFHRTFTLTDENPPLLSVTLTAPLNGQVTVTKLEDRRLAVNGRIMTELELECHRCLRSYAEVVERSFAQVYAERPSDDELPIVHDQLDLAPLIEQELIVGLPFKQLCAADCRGVPGAESYQRS